MCGAPLRIARLLAAPLLFLAAALTLSAHSIAWRPMHRHGRLLVGRPRNASAAAASGFAAAAAAHAAPPAPTRGAPDVYHMIFGLQPTSHLPFGLVHLVGLLSVKLRAHPGELLWHYRYAPPNGSVSAAWWECAAPLVTPVAVGPPVTAVQGREHENLHTAHEADVIRMGLLRERGGVYLDSDVIVLRPLDELRRIADGVPVMGLEEAPGQTGLCNAVIIAPPNTTFLARWWARYADWKPKQSWAYHSVILPLELAREHPSEIRILSGKNFFTPSWGRDDMQALYFKDDGYDFRDNHAVHLWSSLETRSAGSQLGTLTVAHVFAGNGSFHRLARGVLREAAAAGVLCAPIAADVAREDTHPERP